MVNIAIYGAGGFGKETKFLIDVINRNNPEFYFQGFIDDNPDLIVPKARNATYQALSIAIALPSDRRKIYGLCGEQYLYPSLIHPDVFLDKTVTLGKGLIVCAGVKVTVDVQLGNFVIINLNATIGHDVSIGSFSSIMPSVNISGNVRIGEGVFIGSGSTILQNLKIGDGSFVGAGAVVTKDVPSGCIAKGVPARFTEIKSS